MSLFRTLSITTALLIHATSSHAASVDQDFQRCASAAMQDRGQSADAIIVRTGGLNKRDLDHSASQRKSQYRMQVTDSGSGKDMGIVTCTLSRAGEIIAATFER